MASGSDMNADERPSIEIADLTFEIDAARLLDKVNWHAKAGEFIGVIGPNGAGKTTLLRTLAGLLQRTSGDVLVKGAEIESIPVKELAQMLGRVSQEAPSTYGFTGMEVVVMGRYPHMTRFQVEGDSDRAIAMEAMRRTETLEFSDRSVASLSGGERQRIFVARALAQKPNILLLDEPTANLDIQYQLKILEIVKGAANQGMTAVAAIHDLSLAARYCDRLVLLAGGKVIADGRPDQVLTSENLENAYGVRVVVYPDPLTGTLTLSLPELSSNDSLNAAEGRVHVICGGGTGARLMHRLHRAGFTVTSGALGSGDTDRMAADIMGIPYLPLPAFGSIDDVSHTRHLAMVSTADVVVLCDMPIGANNLLNLEAAAQAKRLVTMGSSLEDDRDLTDGVAGRIYADLKPIMQCDTEDEAIDLISRLSVESYGSTKR